MTLLGYIIVLVVLTARINTQAWSWNSDDSNTKRVEVDNNPNPQHTKIHTQEKIENATNVDMVIEAILSLKPKGNYSNEVDEVYRNMIRDKLCQLGLQSCEGRNPLAAVPEDSHQHYYKPPHRQYYQSKPASDEPQDLGNPYTTQYKAYQTPQKHIHHHFHYSSHGKIPAASQTIPKKPPSSHLVGNYYKNYRGYPKGTTSVTVAVTSRSSKRSTGTPMQSNELDDKENFDCVCLARDQCASYDVPDEKDNQQLPLDPRRLTRDTRRLQKTEIKVTVDNEGNMHIIRVPNRSHLNITEDEIRRTKREPPLKKKPEGTKAPYGNSVGVQHSCGPKQVCCKKSLEQRSPVPVHFKCGTRNPEGITGRIKNSVQIEGDSDFGEYPWQVAILKRGPEESGFICGGTLIDSLHIITAAHCVKKYLAEDLKVRLGEWEVNHDTEFFSYVESDIINLLVHPNFYAGTLHNDLAILRMEKPVDLKENPHISPACLPSPQEDFTGTTCWTTGWGKDAFGENGKYQNILQEIDVPIVDRHQCQTQLQNTRLGRRFKLHPGFICAGGEGKDACKGDGGGPMVCEREGLWSVVGIVSWGIGCGQVGVPGVYVNVAHYLDWIEHNTQKF